MSAKRTVLVVEDEDVIRDAVVMMLSRAGFETAEASDGVSALAVAHRPEIDLVLLDLILPKLDGFEVLKKLRAQHPSLPVIIVSARASEDDRVYGLELGADDYIVKPFSRRELLARVEAVLRRSTPSTVPVVTISSGTTTVNCARREIASTKRAPVPLSQMEIDILEELAMHAGRAVSRDQLLSRVWGGKPSADESRALDMHVTRLRQKLASASANPEPKWIVTVRGKGYMLGPDMQVAEGTPPARKKA
jgi:two-component system, OmpR family, response regulator RpaB